MKALILLPILFSLFLNIANEAYAYDDQDTHPRITDRAVGSAALNSFLKNSLGYPEGTLSIVNGDKIVNLLREGSKAEDSPLCRASNHFHNPRQSWNSSNMSDVWQANALCMAKGWLPTYSAVTWATGYQAPAPLGAKLTNMSGAYNWDEARADYYAALISSTTTVRESKFADTFSILGHVMHLLQDMAVPAHTRNDFQSHLKVSTVYGTLETRWTAQPYENYLKINTSLVNFADPIGNYPAFPTPSVTNFWDTDQYNGSNPSASTAIGLAEYSNANFFSDYTIFKGSLEWMHSFPYPASSSVQTYEKIVDSSTGKSKTYLRKVGDGETINHLAAYRLYSRYLPAAVNNLALYLDDKCHDDYARKLIPRAVAYSASLLDYFFRGSIEITVPSNGVYSMIDATQAGFNAATATFTTIKLLAKNTTSTGEDMTNGTIQLVVKYKKVDAEPFQPGLLTTSTDFTYKVVSEKNGISALSRTVYTELNFDLSEAGIPLEATDVYLQVVYHGMLGNEEGAVAIGFKDISEPTPIDFTNNMDKVCINGSWYEAGSQEAIEQVDLNYDHVADLSDVYAHDEAAFYVKFAPYSTTHIDIWASPTVKDFEVPGLTAGSHIRAAYILSDYQFDYSIYNRANVSDPKDPWEHPDYLWGYIRAAIKRQKDYTEDSALCAGQPSCYIDRYPEFSAQHPADGALVFYNFRGISLWWGGQFITINYPYPDGSQCSYDLL